uniref:LysM peptidoglycan-binding domain-containing protein n=1 Tax=Bacillus spizizenii TaxID=96241 RepID=UPI0036F40987
MSTLKPHFSFKIIMYSSSWGQIKNWRFIMATTYSTTTYTVKSGDNLGSIAQRFGMTLSEIQS